jgi:NAD(P)-dependent dehydrogenase (short-subunit alcohol dehydrogenase family)
MSSVLITGANRGIGRAIATEVADAAEKPQLPLRIPVGDAARALLAARHAAPDDAPFVAATL